ncbi:MAG: DUF4369 domain-containing protein [Prevotella sp.]|nr:DUF4369 domain-containing protein [Prevotella sp.]
MKNEVFGRIRQGGLGMARALLLLLLFAACSSKGDRFHFEGRFRNMNQGELYIYDPATGMKDTIAVRDGRFTYDVPMQDTTTLVLLFPNFSELPVFAHPGAEVTLEGDVSHLREVKINGTDDNDDMTEFRLATAEKTPPQVQSQARQFIKDHPQSAVSTYLLQRHLILSPSPDYAEAYTLCAALHRAQPGNVRLALLQKQLSELRNLKQTGQMPPFSATDTQGRPVDNSCLRSKVNVFYVWSMSSYDSQSALRNLRRLELAHPKDLAVVTLSMDSSPAEGKSVIEHDSIGWPNICDGLMWQSPVVAQLGIASLPDNIVTDSLGNILARRLSNADLQNKLKELLGD